MRCIKPINNKRRNCWVCSNEYWPRQCPKVDRPCYTVDQCCREIFDVSYKFNEYFPLVQTVRKAMLPRD